MESALIVLVWIVGLVVIAFFVVIIIAVLKVTSESDDIEERIQYQARRGLKIREDEYGSRPEEMDRDGRGTAHDIAMGEDVRDQQQDAL